MQSIKELNLKANHNFNDPISQYAWLYAIYQRTQSESKSQQGGAMHQSFLILYAIYQRTQSESKSQHNADGFNGIYHCMQSIKELNLKANHNWGLWRQKILNTVCNLSKNSIWKQITTKCGGRKLITKLYAIYQRTQSESKSQLAIRLQNIGPNCMQSIKELNLKANHNWRY